MTNIPQQLPPIQNGTELEEALQQLMVPNNAIIKMAELRLKQFTKSPLCLPAFAQTIQRTQQTHKSVRQMAAVVMRHRIDKHWEKLDDMAKEAIKTAMLEVLIREPEPLVRNAVIRVVAEIAQFEVPSGKWNELAKFLMQCTKHQHPAYREVGMVLCSHLIESIPDEMQKNINHFFASFAIGLKDENLNVRIATLKAIQSFLIILENDKEFETFTKLVPGIIDVINNCLQKGEENVASEAFEIFDDLVELNIESFDKMIPALLKFMLEITTNTKLLLSTRIKALYFVAWVISYKPNIIIRAKFVDVLLKVIFALLVEPENEVEGEEGEEETSHKASASLLSELTNSIPSKYTFRPIVEFSLKLTTSNNPLERKAGITALGIISEGCNEAVRNHLNEIMPAIIKCFSDPNHEVKVAVCYAVAYFSEFLQPQILEYYEQIIPFIIQCLDDPNPEVKEKSCYTLDAFCEQIGTSIIPYAKTIMQKLLELLTKGDVKVQTLAIPAISTIANATQQAFIPYAETVLKMMNQLMCQSEHLVLRARATECVGNVALAIGKEKFAPLLDGFMKLVMTGLQMEHTELKEYTIIFFSSMAGLLKEDFAVYLPTIMDSIIASAVEEASEIHQVKSDVPSFIQDDDDEEDDDDEIDLSNVQVKVRTSLLDEKSAAIQTLGIIANETKTKFIPYLEKTFQALSANVSHFHYDIRRCTMTALRNLIFPLVPGSPQNELPEGAKQLLNNILFVYINAMYDDDDKETVARVCEAMSSLFKQLGTQTFTNSNQIERFVNALVTLLREEATCNKNVLEETGDHDIVLIDAVADVIDDMARAFGQNFDPFFRVLFPELLRYTEKDRPNGDKIMALGTLAECVTGLKQSIAPYIPQLLPVVLSGLQTENQYIRRNAVYCVGLLVLYAKEQTMQHVPQIMTILGQILANRNKLHDPLVDNACSAVARIITAHPDKIPLDKVLPLLLESVPLRDDFQEYDPLCYCFAQLLKSGNNILANQMKKVLSIFGQVLGTTYAQPETQKLMVDVIKALNLNYQKQLEQVVQTLEPKERENVVKALQH